MGFRLAEAFIEFSARTEPALAAMDQMQEKAMATAANMEASLGAASAASIALGSALVAAGTLAATRFASGIGEAARAGAGFGDTMEAGFSSLIGVESHIQKVSESMKILHERTIAEASAMEKLKDAFESAGNSPPPRFAALGERPSQSLEKALGAEQKEAEKIMAERLAAVAKMQGLEAQIKEREKEPGHFAGGPSDLTLTTMKDQLRQLHEIWDARIQLADTASQHLNNFTDRIADANRAVGVQKFIQEMVVGSMNGTVGAGRKIGVEIKTDVHDAEHGRGPLGFLGNGIAGVEAAFKEFHKGEEQIEKLKRNQAQRAEDDAGREAIRARFQPQIDALQHMKGPEFMGLDELSRSAQRAAGPDNKSQIDLLRRQLEVAEKDLANAQQQKHLEENIRDGIMTIAKKTFGWAP